MKKTRTRFLSILLTLCMAFALVPALGISAAAITLRDGAITGDGITGSVSYNSSTQTLTLNNATITADSTPISSAGSLTIELIGNNYITCTYEGDASMHGIYCPVLTFTGSGNLTASANDYGIFAYTSLTFNGTGTITGNGQTGISGGNKGATINSGTVIATGRDSDTLSCGFTTTGNLTVNGGSLTGTSGSASISNSKGVWVNNGNLILNGGTVKAISNDDKGIGCSVKGSSGNERFILNSGSLITSGGLRACNGLFAEPDKSDVHFYVADNISGTGKSEYFPETWPVELSDDYIEVTATSTVSSTITFTDLDMPGKGKTLDTTATASDSGVTVTKVTYLMFNKTVDEVREGDPVTIGIYVTLKDGYSFPDNMKAILGGVYGNLASAKTIAPSASPTTRAFTFELTVPKANEIVSVAVTGIDTPIAGAMPDLTCTVGGTGYEVYELGWINETDGGWHSASTPFADGKAYKAVIYLQPSSGYTFAAYDAMTAKVNGNTADYVSDVSGKSDARAVAYTFPALKADEIASVAVTGIDVPAVGATPDTTAVAGASTYTVSSVAWSPEATTFAGGSTYTATVTLKAAGTAKFTAAPTATINGSAATIVSGAGTQELKVSYTFPALKDYTAIALTYNKTNVSALPNASVTLTVTSDLPTTATSIKYQWYRGTGAAFGSGSAISDATSASYTIPTADAGTTYYYCIATATVNGKAVTSKDATTTVVKVVIDKTAKLPFADVGETAYYYDAVLWAVDKGVTEGTSATTFSPNATCTRAQAVTFLWRAAGEPIPEATTMPFTDVAEGSYYYGAVLWAVEQGITEGTSDTTFSPDATCTRGQIVTFLYRAAGSPAATASNPFSDVSADAYYADAVLWAVGEGITEGTSTTTFSPADDCTRGQIVTFLYRYMGE